MKFRAHDTFAIRKGWLHKGMKHIKDNPRLFVDKNINPMDELGIGSNMVKALRYWLQVFGLTEETGATQKYQEFTDLGQLIWDNDLFMEEDGTFCILHYMLASNKDQATAWYYFFNIYNMNEITKESFVADIQSYISVEEPETQVSEKSLGDDFDCIIKTYFKSNSSDFNPESNIESPLTELGLIKLLDKKNKIYSKMAPSFATINPLIILAIIIRENEKEKSTDIKISKIEKDPGNIGKIFNLDKIQVAQYLDNLQNQGLIKVVRSAGLDIVKLQTKMSFIECIKKYYESLSI